MKSSSLAMFGRNALPLFMIVFLFGGCADQKNSSNNENANQALTIDAPLDISNPGGKTYEVMLYLSESIGKRVAGSDNEKLARDYIANEFTLFSSGP